MATDPSLTYFLCCTPRSGSTFVAHIFQQTERLGLVDEFVNSHSREQWETDAGRYLDGLFAEKSSPNGVFGIKTHFQEFMNVFMSRHLARFGAPRFLYLERRDRVRQAISLVKAFRRGWWNTVEADRPEKEYEYDFDEVLRSLDFVLDQYRAWDQLFAALDIDRFRIVYEDFVDDPVGITVRAAEFLGVEIDTDRIDPARLPVKRQAGSSTDAWRARFVADARARLGTDSLDAFLETYPYLRWNYPDLRIRDFAREAGLPLLHSPAPESLRLRALERLRESGHLEGETNGAIDRSAIEAMIRYLRAAGLFVEPRMTPRIAERIAGGIGRSRPEVDLSGEWAEETNDAEFGFVSAQQVRDGLVLFCVYRRNDCVVSWTSRLLNAEGDRMIGSLWHRSDLRADGWKDAVLDLRVSGDGMRISGTVTPQGEGPSPITLVRRRVPGSPD